MWPASRRAPKLTPSEADHMTYDLVLYDESGDVVSLRTFRSAFDGIGKDGTWSSEEEYLVSRMAREMYRDAAYAAGKWPTRKT